MVPVFSCPAGRGVLASRTGRGRPHRAGRSARNRARHGRALVGGGAAPAPWRIPASASRDEGRGTRDKAYGAGGRSLFAPSARRSPPQGGEVAGVARRDEPESAVAAPG